MEDYRRTMIFHERCFLDFYGQQRIKVQDKIDHVIDNNRKNGKRTGQLFQAHYGNQWAF